jgi:hypothetical protein
MRWAGGSWMLVLVSAGTVAAEPQTDPPALRLLNGPPLALKPGILTRYLGEDLAVVASNRHDEVDVAMSMDLRARRAKVRLGGGSHKYFALRVSSDVDFRKGAPRVSTTLNLGLAGKDLAFTLPEVTVVPRSYLGQRYIEYQIPVLRQEF